MRITVVILVVAAAAAVAHAAEGKSPRNEQKNEESSRTDKRAPVEGNSAVERRAPALPTASPSVSPGIEYADSEAKVLQREHEQSPAQQIYATPVPQLAKISDVLSGHHLEQGPGQFQAAIASHLYSPVSIYQTRLSSPTTYEVSAPVASQLAYSEKISYRPQPVQYTPQVRQYNQLSPQLTYRNVQAAKQQAFARFPEQILVQQPLYQRQILYQNPQLQYQNQPVYTHAPQVLYQNQIQPYYSRQLVAHPSQVHPPQVHPPQVQPGILYARQEASSEQVHEQPAQRELKTQAEPKVLEKQMFTPEQNYNLQHSEQSQGAVSYASFSQSQPAALIQPHHQQRPQYRYQSQPLITYQPQQHQHQQEQQEQHAQPQTQYQTQTQEQPQYQQSQPYQPQPQYQSQIQQAESQAPYQSQYQAQSLHQEEPLNPTQVQTQPQYQIQPQYTQKLVSSANAISPSTKPVVINPGYFRTLLPVPQAYSGQGVPVQGTGYGDQPIAVAPTYPPVQYFGKFAQSIFGSYQR